MNDLPSQEKRALRPVALVLAALMAALPPAAVVACEGQPGAGPFVVAGWVVDEAGRPCPGLTLALVPVIGETGDPDLDNGVYQIAERDDYQTRTNAEGLFVMSGVWDYRENSGHRYQVIHVDPLRYPDRNPFLYLTGGEIDFSGREPEMVKTRLVAHPGGGVEISAHDAQGRPYTGPWAVAIAAQGRTWVYTAQFVEGVHRHSGLPPGLTRVGLLSGNLAYYLTRQAHERGVPIWEHVATQEGRPAAAEVQVTAGQWTSVRFVLP